MLTSLVVFGSAMLLSAAGVAAAAAWSSAGDLELARLSHKATLLTDGRVLVTGGNTAVGNTYDTKTAEIYDPPANTWSTTGSTTNGRAGHTATRLADGQVLITGGVNANVCTFDTTAELYDPATGTWSFTGSLSAARYFGVAAPLADGRVLVAGGGNRCGIVFSSAELYDPSARTWSDTDSMTTPREFFNAVVLADGRVLAAGGAGPGPFFSALSSAEIYDPTAGTWIATDSMATARIHPMLVVLSDGRVMATGGYSTSGVANGPGVEIFDPAIGMWSATGSLSVARSNGTLSLLSSGMVLAAGGTDGTTTHASAELWDPASGTWSATASMTAARISHTATVLGNGNVLVAAGYDGVSCCLTSAELYTFDDQGPLTSEVAAAPNPVAVNASTTLTATVDDSTTGGSHIASADYQVDGGPWTPMAAADGTFDEVEEDVTATFNAPPDSSIYDLCVRGTDTANNVGSTFCIQLVVYDPSGGFVTGGGWIDSPSGATGFTPSWYQGFETDTAGWFDFGAGTVNREPSGFTDTYASGIDSADGDYHARLRTTDPGGCAPPFSQITACVGPLTRWGKATSTNATFPVGGYRTEVDVYLDTAWADEHADWRFDFSSAINRSSDGSHLRDFAFNFGTDPGGDPNFVVNASTNAFRSSSFPSNPCPSPSAAPNICRTPVEITTSGWYTLQHTFRDDGGSLAVDMRILEESGATVADWTIYSGDAIGGVGGNRYGWFANQEVHNLAIDNSTLYLPPTGRASFGFVSKYQKGATLPTGNTQFVFQAGDLNLHSSSYDWLVVTGSDYARFKGTADVNGVGGYGFMVWAGDGTGSDGADSFRIKITDPSGNTVYDNGMDQPIGGGSIIVHKGK